MSRVVWTEESDSFSNMKKANTGDPRDIFWKAPLLHSDKVNENYGGRLHLLEALNLKN